MKKKLLHIVILLLTLVLFSCKQQKTDFQLAENGVLKVDSIFENQMFPLDGQWEFYWKKLLIPSNFEKYSADTAAFVKVNSVWNNYIVDGQKIGNFTYGTFHLQLVIPKGEYALKFKRIETAYNIWVDDLLVAQNGTVGTNANSSVPDLNPQIVFFESQNDTTSIVIQVSNFHHRVGGIQNKIIIGKPQTIVKSQSKGLISTFFMLGSFLIIAIFFLFNFLFIKNGGVAPLYFSLTILLSALFASVNGESIFTDVFSNMTWELTKKIDFISNYGRIIFFVLFLRQIFIQEKLLKNIFSRIIMGFLFVFSGLIIVTKASFFTSTLYPFLGVTLVAFFYIIFLLSKLSLKRDRRAFLILIGTVVIVLSMLNDLFSYMNLISTPYLANFGLFVFILTNAIILALNISSAHSTNTKYSQLWGNVNYIRNQLTNIKPFELEKMLKIISDNLKSVESAIFIENNENIKSEILYKDGFIRASYLNEPLKYSVDKSVIEKMRITRNVVVEKNSLAYPVFDKNSIKAFIFLKNSRINRKQDADVLEMLHTEFSTFLDNYIYYYSLENLNKNLETIVEKRIETITKQKEQLLINQASLDEKLEELNITNGIVEDLNNEIIERTSEISTNIDVLENKNEEILAQKEIIEKKISTINSSVEYSNVILKTLLSSQKNMSSQYFELSLPKETVSGDIWFSHPVGDYLLIAVIDSTGHNITSTFITILIKTLFEELLAENPEIATIRPDEFVKLLKINFFEIIDKNQGIEDSFDIFFSSLNIKTGEFLYCGENLIAHLARNKQVTMLDVDKRVFIEKRNFDYNLRKTTLNYNDILYLQTDGFMNQIRREDMRKFGVQRINEMLTKIQNSEFDEHDILIEDEFINWKKDMKQVDDYLAVGLFFKKQ
ncbi:MAG: SpoIIE family protein phosphatase [Bacteroidales bacterium]|nr:SpoIIE family protein phosphatase [Bacteroidales bacterium]